MIAEPAKRIAFVSSYRPRKCGIATFTSDLISNVRLAAQERFQPVVIAVNSGGEIEYDDPVKLRIRKDFEDDYLAAADYLNFSDVDVVSVQHEFGLFGGKAGSHLSLLLERLDRPVVTTLHTVMDKPSPEYFDSLVDVCDASNTVVVMNKCGIDMLEGIYGVPGSKIELIPHGIPDFPFADSSSYKRKLGLAERRVILTFGLLSRNKGIEVMLRALPMIVKYDPSVLYVVLGLTHPEVLSCEGQSYRIELERMVRKLRLEKNVVFHNRFVSDEELFAFLGAADIYVTPYLHKEQMTSGTLAFAVGAGKAVVSTPYWAAQELLAGERGKMVPFDDHAGMARSILKILVNESLFHRIRKRAYEYGRSMTWPKVGKAYSETFKALVPSIRKHPEPQVGSPSRKMSAYGRQRTLQLAHRIRHCPIEV